MALGVPCKKSAVFATGTFNLLIFSTGDVPSLTAIAVRSGLAAPVGAAILLSPCTPRGLGGVPPRPPAVPLTATAVATEQIPVSEGFLYSNGKRGAASPLFALLSVTEGMRRTRQRPSTIPSGNAQRPGQRRSRRTPNRLHPFKILFSRTHLEVILHDAQIDHCVSVD